MSVMVPKALVVVAYKNTKAIILFKIKELDFKGK